jgi:hypothetical protein
MSAKEEREAMLAMVASVSDEVRLLISLSQTGLCPFCLGDLSIGGPGPSRILRGSIGDLRGPIGDMLRDEVARREQAAREAGCGPDGHALDCRLQQMLKEEEA